MCYRTPVYPVALFMLRQRAANPLRRRPRLGDNDHHSIAARGGRTLRLDPASRHKARQKLEGTKKRCNKNTTECRGDASQGARPDLKRAVINLHRFLHANLGGTDDWPIKFTGTEEHTPELCRLLNELQNEMERAGHRPGRFKFTAAYRKRQATNPE